MTPATLGPVVTPYFVRPIEEGEEPDPDRPLLRLYVGPRFFMGAVPLQLRAWAGIPKAGGEQPVIVALQQWREGAKERLNWPDWEASGAGGPAAAFPTAGDRSVESAPATELPLTEYPPVEQKTAVEWLTYPRSAWTTPSRELTFEMLNVSRGRWQEILGPEDDFDLALERLTNELRDDLAATIANYAVSAMQEQQETVALTANGRFVPEFAREVTRILPIDPYIAPEALEQLRRQLLAQLRREPLRAWWGSSESAGDLVLHLRKTDAGAGGASTAPPAIP